MIRVLEFRYRSHGFKQSRPYLKYWTKRVVDGQIEFDMGSRRMGTISRPDRDMKPDPEIVARPIEHMGELSSIGILNNAFPWNTAFERFRKSSKR